jgi:hypothetical protein
LNKSKKTNSASKEKLSIGVLTVSSLSLDQNSRWDQDFQHNANVENLTCVETLGWDISRPIETSWDLWGLIETPWDLSRPAET